jgi:S-methylmethionine-dependent homocysteine/selenocysteine methylase
VNAPLLFGFLKVSLWFDFFVVLALLFNCSEPESITRTLEAIRHDATLLSRLRSHQILLGAYANRLAPIPNVSLSTSSSGTPQPLRTDLTPPQYYHDFIQPWIQEYNVQVIGGCCGVSPQHIAFINKQLYQ